MPIPIMTSEHALFLYHQTYDNHAYQAACGAMSATLPTSNGAWQPIYTRLSNLLTDTALESCGHPAYQGVGWTLAYELHQHGLATPAVIGAVEAYLSRFRLAMTDYNHFLLTHPAAQTVFLVGAVQLVVGETVQVVQQADLPAGILPSLQASAAYLRWLARLLAAPTSPPMLEETAFRDILQATQAVLTALQGEQALPPLLQQTQTALQSLLEG